MNAPVIAPDTLVTLSYVLFDEQGEAVDRVTFEEPLTYVHGYAQLVPGLERQIEGLKAGDRGAFTVDADEAFGQRDDEAVFEVERSDFPANEVVAVGDEFMAEGADGEPIAMRVVEVRDEGVVVDTNHPLAGQRVRFEVEVAAVRPATEEEIAAAQAELEDMAEGDMACGCGHEHGPGDDHDHDHDHDHAEHEQSVVQLSKKRPS
jgi:FKBP-type peptidyl-prolyl cis-trans isomerase SlyD